MKTIFLRVLDTSDKAATLRAAIREPADSAGTRRFELDAERFKDVPRSPFAYWVADSLRALFGSLASFEAEGRTAKQGLATADDFRFIRGWWEVPSEKTGQRWFPIVKGGKFAPY